MDEQIDPQDQADHDETVKKFETHYIYRYRKIDKNSLNALSCHQHWASSLADFNDPYELKLRRDPELTGIQEVREKFPPETNMTDEEYSDWFYSKLERGVSDNDGIVCFSFINAHILMWAHYAEDHKGMCLEFHCEHSSDLRELGLLPVAYLKDYIELPFNKILSEEGMAATFYYKFRDWKYEKELRLVLHEQQKKLIDYHDKMRLSKVIFGVDTPNSDKQLVQSVLKGENVQYAQAVMSQEEYKLIIEPLED